MGERIAPWATQGNLQVGGVRLEYACHGPQPGEAPTLVLMHEGLGCVALWRDFPAALAKATGMGVFLFSRQGYGKSDLVPLPRPLDFMTREAQQVLPHVLGRIGVRRFILVGHSDGASISAIYAGSTQDSRLRGLILMAPHFFTESGGLAEIAAARRSFDAGDLKARLEKYHDNVEGAFRGWNDVWLHPGFQDWDVTEVLDYIRVPVLAIQGQQDQYGTLAQINVISERAYAPVELVELAECRHSPHLEQRALVLKHISEFAARLWRIDDAVVATA